MLSAYHPINDRLAVMGNLVWQDWAEFGKPDISAANVSNETADLNYDDTWGFALGAQYRFAERWLWSVGGGFDTSPMSKGERSPNVPLDQQFRLGTGIQYSFNQLTVGAAYEYMNARRRRSRRRARAARRPARGRLQVERLPLFSLNLSWRF